MTISDPPAEDQGRRTDLVPRVPGQVPLDRISARTITAIVVAIAVFLYLVRAILPPFVISGVVAFICRPVVARLAAWTRGPRWLAATLLSLVIIMVAGAFLALVVPLVVQEVGDAIANLQGMIESVVHWWFGSAPVAIFGQKSSAPEIARHVVDGLRDLLGQSAPLLSVATSAVGLVIGGVLSIVLLFYFMIGGPSIANSLFWTVPPKQRPLAHAVWAQLDPVLTRYFLAMAVVVFYATVVAYVGLGVILHLRNAVVLAVVTGILETVPVVGPIASAVIAGLAAVRSATGVGSIIAYAVYALVLRLSIDQVVSPLVLGHAGRVHPVLIIFCFLAGGLLFGVVGIILAIPVALTIKVVLATLYEEPLDDERQKGGKAIAPG